MSVRGLHVMSGNLYAVADSSVFQVGPGLGVTFIGSINTTGQTPVSMIDNGTQLAIFDGQNGYVLQTFPTQLPTFNVIALPFPQGPVYATYQDGFGLVNLKGTQLWYQSNLKDLSTWQALNFSSADSQPDNIQALTTVQRVIWIFKQFDTELWVNAGLGGFAFTRIPEIYIEYGCVAPFSLAQAGQSLLWVSQNKQGQGMVMMSTGYQVKRISTHAIEHAFNGYSTLADAIAFVYQQEGHTFYFLTFPTADVTWCFDITTSALGGQPFWHQRAALDNGQFHRHWANAYAFFNNVHVIGDYRNNNLYKFDLDAPLDNGIQRKWLRSWRALAQPSEDPISFKSLRIDMQTGIQVPDGTAPQCMLRWSDDGGHNWSNGRIGAVGATGATSARVKFNRLGGTRRNSGLDRIFELSSTDSFGVALIGAELES